MIKNKGLKMFTNTMDLILIVLVGAFLCNETEAQEIIKSGNHPFDFGDFMAIVIIMILMFGGICACLGKYARIRSGQL